VLSICSFYRIVYCYYRSIGSDTFCTNTNLGYDRDNLIYIQIEGELSSKYPLFKERAFENARSRYGRQK